jgi:hypothetical protein
VTLQGKPVWNEQRVLGPGLRYTAVCNDESGYALYLRDAKHPVVNLGLGARGSSVPSPVFTVRLAGYNRDMSESPSWKYLTRKPKSAYRQLFVKDRWIAARTLYSQTVGDDARTPEAVAADYDLPLEVVREAIAYCESDPPEIREDWEREEASIQRRAASANGTQSSLQRGTVRTGNTDRP